ncbi:NUDIX domain-containing protein [Parahaliea maris]|nr:NUDIX domain-containing protein [Parahaliea maris]
MLYVLSDSSHVRSVSVRLSLPQFLPDIRNAVRALVVNQGSLLMLEKWDDTRGRRFALPGGAQDPGEPLLDALQRECEEEIGTSVEVDDLVFCCDYFKQRGDSPPTRRHVVEFVFSCHVPAGYEPANGYRPDKHQVGVRWVPLTQLADLVLIPEYVAELLASGNIGDPLYAGLHHGR